MKDIMGMMKQAKDLQEKMQRLQEEVAALTIEGSAGGGLIKVTVNGKSEMKNIKIDPSLLKPDEAEILEDLIVAAINDARGKAEFEARREDARADRRPVAAAGHEAAVLGMADRIAVISGVNGGIGRALAEGFTGAGYAVTGVDRGDAQANAGHDYVRLDITDTAAVAAFAAGLGRVDVIVNAAGIIRRVEEFEIAVFEEVVDINLTGTMRLCTACRPALARAGGAIVNIASMLAFFGGGLVPAYAASKGGVAQLTKSLAIAWAKDGIRVNALAPGWIATAMTEPLRRDEARNRAHCRAHADGAVGNAGRPRRPRPVPGERRRPLRHRRHPAGRRRLFGHVRRQSMPAPVRDSDPRMPYQLPMPREASADLVIGSVLPEDERIWVPQAPNVWFRPLCLNAAQGYWVNLLKVTRAGVLSRHRHTNPVHGYVLKGRWHYLEHDWVATEGGYVYEPPGETHTLVVPDDVAEMITLFQVNGLMLYVDPYGDALAYEDVFTKIDMCRRHYAACGLGRGVSSTSSSGDAFQPPRMRRLSGSIGVMTFSTSSMVSSPACRWPLKKKVGVPVIPKTFSPRSRTQLTPSRIVLLPRQAFTEFFGEAERLHDLEQGRRRIVDEGPAVLQLEHDADRREVLVGRQAAGEHDRARSPADRAGIRAARNRPGRCRCISTSAPGRSSGGRGRSADRSSKRIRRWSPAPSGRRPLARRADPAPSAP